MAAVDDQVEYRSGDAMFSFGADLRVRSWNAAAERLTGVPESEAIGRPCWQLLAGALPDGTRTCHATCSNARLAASGWPVRCFNAVIRTAKEPLLVTLSTIAVRNGGEPLLIHLMREAPPPPTPIGDTPAGADREAPRLTPRQSQVFELIGRGAPAKVISDQLGVSEATVRNHIRAILIELRCNSQLAAVARGRVLGIL
jgi:PAS domain S-box-containing protein